MKPLVFDLGSGTCKVGFAGDYSPRCVFRSAISRSTLEVNKIYSLLIWFVYSIQDISKLWN